MERLYLNDKWKFTENYTEAFTRVNAPGGKTVRIPHTVRELPYNYADEKSYQMLCCYRRELYIPPAWLRKRVFITFEGAAHVARVFLNGEKLTTHNCGYTAFTVELTGHLRYGEINAIAVQLDTRESCNVPPFGYAVDYLTYGGIYRDVYIDVKEQSCIADVFVYTEEARRGGCDLSCEVAIAGGGDIKNNDRISLSVADQHGRVVLTGVAVLHELSDCKTEFPECLCFSLDECRRGALCVRADMLDKWSPDNPVLYSATVSLVRNGQPIDTKVVRFGRRDFVFQPDGLYINGEKTKILGLNRHQSYPYVGYAMPKSMQVMDADILKNELCVNAVRTSHYPQSQYFIDRCDEVGLLVFTEIPGWQYIGNKAWSDIAINNVREMVTQYRNHPSVMIWGVRINESQDNTALYALTNAAAHSLDPTRPTSGVRDFEDSSLLEDIYSYNDFTWKGDDGSPLLGKRKATSDMKKPFIVTEFNGTTFPTKSFDNEGHRAEQARRHTRIINAMYNSKDIAGCFGWCMFDYNTHSDFGSGDRICYHGVMDMFRNPKLAASVYASQSESSQVLAMSHDMAIGEHPAGARGDIYLYTNADFVRLFRNDSFVRSYQIRRRRNGMPHAPILLDDLIGETIESEEGIRRGKANRIKSCLLAASKYGPKNLPFGIRLRMFNLKVFGGMKQSDAVRLYGKYVGNWGEHAATYRVEASCSGRIIGTLVKGPSTKVRLQADADHVALHEDTTYDVAAIRIRAVDEYNNQLTWFSEPVVLRAEGCIELIGPSCISLKGGAFGTFVRTTGDTGKGTLTISCAQAGVIRIEFEVM